MAHINDNNPLLAGLNTQQSEAVRHTEGPLLIFAGAGSGKTRVLTHRVAWLISQKRIYPGHILAVTFTNKAATEMKERITRLVGEQSRSMWISTFHATCARILRQSGDSIGLDRKFVIYDDGDQMSLMRQCMNELKIDDKRFPPRAILSQISAAKEKMLLPDQYSEVFHGYFEDTCYTVYQLYQQKLKQNNALDFDDLLMQTVRLLQKRPEVLEGYQCKFQYILVDEYQDVNYVQYLFLQLLAKKSRNICVVGDDDQSIYGWRGADVKLILRFEEDYPEARVIKLEQNYRSTGAILEAAHRVVCKNKGRKDKKLWTEQEHGLPLVLKETDSEQQEAVFAALEIRERVMRAERRFGDFAILYRTNAQSRAFEDVFLNFSVPYRIVGGLRFYERKEVKDLLAYLRIVQNPSDSVSLKRIINMPARAIGATTLRQLDEYSMQHSMSFWEALHNTENMPTITNRAKKAVKMFVSLIEGLQDQAQNRSLSEITRETLTASGYLSMLEGDRTTEGQNRLENVRELLTVTGEFDKNSDDTSLGTFLEQVALVTDLDTVTLSQEAVTLMTLHAAKGLEFPVVFLAGMEEGIFPHIRSLESPQQLEEERRLCYVGITRAQQELFLTHAYRRTLYGATQYNPRSRFLDDIPEELMVGAKKVTSFFPDPEPSPMEYAPAKRTTWASMQPNKLEKAAMEVNAVVLRPGQKVEHSSFGVGVVLSVTEQNGDKLVSVAFPGKGVKKLMQSVARLKPL